MLDKTRKPLFPQLETKNIFLKKIGFVSPGKRHTVPKTGTLWDFFKYTFCCKWEQNFCKVAQCREKSKGDLCTEFALAGLGLTSFSIFCKKLTDQCEVCGLKKKCHCKIRAFFFKRKKRQLKTVDFTLPLIRSSDLEASLSKRLPSGVHTN